MKTCLKAVICFLVVLVFCACYAQQASAATMMLPGDLRTIEEEAFAGDTSLDEVVVPEGVQRIKSRAFADSSLKAISLPSTLRSLADDAFDGTSLSEVNAEWNTLGANWAITNGVKLATSAPSSFSSEETIHSAGNTKAENGTDVTAYLGKCFTVQDEVGGWFKFTAPVSGSYTFSVKAPDISQSFYIRISANRTGTISLIKEFRFDQSDEVVTYRLDDVIEGETIYWWDAKSSNKGKTFLDPFQLMVAPVEYISKVEVKTAVITGTVIDAITGQGIAGVTVSVVDIEDTADEQSLLMGTGGIGIGTSAALGAVYSTVTDQYGYYSLLAPIGLQLLHFELPGYISYDQEVNVSSDGGDVPQAILSKELTGDQYRVVLKWGNTPADLDSHLINENFHVYYAAKTATGYDAMLDLDDTDGVGPETVTFTVENNQTYSYYVKDYTNRDSTSSSALGASGATVMIYHGNSVTEKHVPKGVGIYWHVFDLVNGRIQYVDTIGNTEPTASGTALSSVVVSATPESQTVGNSGASPFKYTISWTDNIESLHVYIEGMNFIEEWSKENGGTASDSYADGKGGIGDEALAQKMKQYTFYPVSGTMPNDYVVQIWAEDESGRGTEKWTGILTVDDRLHTTEAKAGTEEAVDKMINETIQTEEAKKTLANGLSVVFMIEGAGTSSDTSVRRNGLCVVVKNDENGVPQIVFESNYCSSIPDRPKDETSNEGDAVPTLIDGTYTIKVGSHWNEGKKQNSDTGATKYACLDVINAKVARFSSDSPNGYVSTSSNIQIHRRSSNNIYQTGSPNSAGCNLVGAVQGSGTERYSNKYNEFMYKVGAYDSLVENQAIPLSSKTGQEIGIYVVDRSLAKAYLVSLYGEEGAKKVMGTSK